MLFNGAKYELDSTMSHLSIINQQPLTIIVAFQATLHHQPDPGVIPFFFPSSIVRSKEEKYVAHTKPMHRAQFPEIVGRFRPKTMSLSGLPSAFLHDYVTLMVFNDNEIRRLPPNPSLPIPRTFITPSRQKNVSRQDPDGIMII